MIVALLVAIVVALRFTLFAPKPVEVEVAPVERGLVEETITNSRAGSVRARHRARLSPELGGQVVALPYREGDSVAAGEVLLRLDDRAQRARLELARRDVETATAERRRTCLEAERALRELERTRRLAADQIVSVDLLDRVESAHEAADAACASVATAVERARAAVDVAQVELSKTVLTAPFDGVIAEIAVEVGEWTTPSPPALPVPPVIDVLDPGSLFVSAPMDEVDSARIVVGQAARVTVDSHRDRSLAGRVTRVAPYVLDVQEQNRTVEIEVELEDQELAAHLLPGTSADVEVILSAHEDVARMPTAALIEGTRALTLVGGVLEERTIEIGLSNWDFTEVRGGLEVGEEVVVSLDRPEVVAGARAELVAEGPAG